MQNELEKQKEQLYKYLTQKYKRTVINKVEMAFELGISNSTLDLYIAKGIGIPNYKKLGYEAKFLKERAHLEPIYGVKKAA